MANNGKFAAIDQGVISLANFLAAILISRYVSPTELGIYVIGFLAIFLIRAVQNGIIVQPLNTFGAVKSDQDFKSYFSAMVIHQVILSIVTSVSAAILGTVLIFLGNENIGPAIFVLWFSFMTWQMQEFLRRAFYTRGEVAKAIWISITANFVRLSLILLLSSQSQISGRTGLNAIGWGSLFATLVGVSLARHYFTKHVQNLRETWQENWQFGRWILGASVADWMVVDLYPIMVAGMISIAATGIYQALQNLVAPIHVLLRAVDTFATPILAKIFDQSGFEKVNKNLILIYLISGVPVVILLVVVILFTPQLLLLISGETYLPYADGIYVMAVFYFFIYVNRPLQIAFRAIREGKQIFLANILAAISMFSIGFVIINRWGHYGAMGGQALNAIIISLVLLIAWCRYAHSERFVKADV